MDIALGEVAKSKAGRDAGRYFVIIRIIGGGYVLVVDGNLRKLEKPKKKKLKHLETTGNVIKELVPGLQDSGRKLTDADIRKALSNYFVSGGIGK